MRHPDCVSVTRELRDPASLRTAADHQRVELPGAWADEAMQSTRTWGTSMQASGATGTPDRERWNKVEELCDRYLGGRPSEAALQVLKKAEQQRPEVRDFVERAFRLMALSKF